MSESRVDAVRAMPQRVSLSELATFLSEGGVEVRILEGAASKAAFDVLVEHVTEDSRRVRAGSLFVARRGEQVDGTRFIPGAVGAGATALLVEEGTLDKQQLPCLFVDDLRRAWGLAAHLIWGQPSARLKMVGVTGTNGKTTVASLVTSALRGLGQSVVQGGTLGFFLDERRLGDSLTTPMPDQLAARLAEAVAAGANYGVLEASSHALEQQRTAGIQWDAVGFSNLSQDHLDYHGTMEAYFESKSLLFVGRGDQAVINVDNSWGRRLAERHPEAIQVASTAPLGPASGAAAPAFLRADAAHFSERGIAARLVSRDAQAELNSPLLGRHNLENLLLATGLLLRLGFSLEEAVLGLETAPGVPGRLERCEAPQDDVVVLVDYAHTPDALSRVLATLQELCFADIVCVFGCGGDRDRTKRPLMGAAAAEGATRLYVTSDNPRSEQPEAILRDILPGLGGAQARAVVEVDRRRAIEQAVCEARPGACVLIAGKGHEDYQLVGDQVLHFDDRNEARRALVLRRSLIQRGPSTRGSDPLETGKADPAGGDVGN